MLAALSSLVCSSQGCALGVLCSDFEKYLASHGPTPIEFTVQILTTGFWPTYKHVEVPLPPEMTA